MPIRTSPLRAFAVLIATVASIGTAHAQGVPVQDTAIDQRAASADEAPTWIAHTIRYDGYAIPLPMTRRACLRFIFASRAAAMQCMDTKTGDIINVD